MRATQKKLLRDLATSARSVLTAGVSLNYLAQDADGIHFDSPREFDELDDTRDLLEKANFLVSSIA